jgi:SAM-dependent methyltransferase
VSSQFTAPDRTARDGAGASLQGTTGAWWNEFFSDRSRPIPFFRDRPDENLAEWFSNGLVAPGSALEFGCGNGRNALYLAGRGCSVDAVDFSEQAITWARERAAQAALEVNFQCCSIFDADIASESYDFVYDAGCFHHLPPDRRADYVSLVARVLRPRATYGLVCFRPEGGSGYTDEQAYEQGSLGGGLGYSQDSLRSLWDRPPFSVRELRQMNQTGGDDPYFGLDFLCVMRATREPTAVRNSS